MKQITVYSFNELSSDVQDELIERFAFTNVEYDWWQFTYEDAKTVGLKITGFDLDHKGIDIEFIRDAPFTAGKIMSEHGDQCDTHKLASEFEKDRDALVEKYSDGIRTDIVDEENEYEFDQECDELEEEFLRELGEEYLSILRKEYEYLTSDNFIIEMIEENGWTFTKDGTQVY